MLRMRVLSRTLLATAASLSLGLAACHSGTPGDESDTTAITNRPQSYDRFIAVLKLGSPALLSTAQTVDGQVKVDDTLKAAINAEQEAAIASLKALSPDVQVLYRYKMVLNGLAVVAPRSLESKFRQLTSVSYVESDSAFERMAPVSVNDVAAGASEDIAHKNSVTFIGADRVHNDLHITGKGVTVGVIDTGIDYTHKMFGGAGTEQAYKDIDPSAANPAFPTEKVVGGIDLVGTEYNSAAADFALHVPKADANPLDEAGHGSHVSGTIAGLGDDVNTYSGVAPDAKLFAIKVFGKEGSTGDAVIIDALEIAADPNGDGDGKDHLDVVNLSLGSSFGTPHILYQEAVANLSKGNTMVVASAGNSGENQYIVGAPSTANDALSVAASIDGMDHNWKFSSVAFKSAAHPELFSEAIEGTWSKPVADVGDLSGKLVFIGNAAQDLTDEQKAAVKGNVALIDRGVANFSDKGKRAFEAGATGVVVANNVAGEPFVMGGDGKYDGPAIMITQALGDILKADMAQGDVTIQWQTDHKIEKPELIDTLTDFSSRGPRSIDGAIKPEISAPGNNVISVKMGGGDKAVQMSGTSMAAPHMTGVVALLKQAHPELSVESLKSLAMGTALSLKNGKTGQVYPVAFMGSGRVDAFQAVSAKLVASPASLSLGEVLVEQAKTVRTQLSLTNLADQAATLTLTPDVKAGLQVTLPATLALAAHETKTVDVVVKITPPASDDASQELDGFINVTGDTGSYHVPLLAVVNRTTRVTPKSLVVRATSPADAAGAVAELTIANNGLAKGDALVFNLLGSDERKEAARANDARNGICDLESAGWRVVKKTVDGATMDVLQIAAKLYNPLTSWHLCEISIQLDGNGDGVADQELLGTYLMTLTNNAADTETFASVLTDANQMRKIRHDFEIADAGAADPNYSPAVLDMEDYQAYGHSTVAVVEADLSKLAKTPAGDLKIKLAVLADTLTPEADDFLGKTEKWQTLTPTALGQAFTDLPETLTLNPGEARTVTLTKGGAAGDLVVYLPFNASTESTTAKDSQAKVLKPKFNP